MSLDHKGAMISSLTRIQSNITSATFTLKWNVMPKVGILAYGDEAQTGSIEVPKKLLAADGQKTKPEKMWY